MLLFYAQILLDNKAHSGKVKISLDNQASIKECRDPSVSGHGKIQLPHSLHFSDQFLEIFYIVDNHHNCSHAISLSPADSYARVWFDVAVAVVCILSLLLCGRSIIRGIILQNVRYCIKQIHSNMPKITK